MPIGLKTTPATTIIAAIPLKSASFSLIQLPISESESTFGGYPI